MIKLVDPIHVFDARGRSLLEYDRLESRNRILELQIERLKRIVRKQHERAGPPEIEIKPIMH